MSQKNRGFMAKFMVVSPGIRGKNMNRTGAPQALIQKWAAENNVDCNSDMKMAGRPSLCFYLPKSGPAVEVGII